MHKFLEIGITQLVQEEIENLNKSITSIKIDSVVKNHQTKKSSGPHGFTGEFFQTFNEEFMPTFIKQFQKQKRKEQFSTHFLRSALS